MNRDLLYLTVSIVDESHANDSLAEPYAVMPESVRNERTARKRGLARPPGAFGREIDPVEIFDSFARRLPPDDAPMWTLHELILWITERSPEGRGRLLISQEDAMKALVEVRRTLTSGDLILWARIDGAAIPQAVPPETWLTHGVAYEPQLEGAALRAIIAREDEVEPDSRFADLQVRRTDVMAHWPAAEAKAGSSVAAERACQRWLEKLMAGTPDRPASKGKLKSGALDKFPGLSVRGFERSWSLAVKVAGAKAWAKAGRRKSGNKQVI